MIAIDLFVVGTNVVAGAGAHLYQRLPVRMQEGEGGEGGEGGGREKSKDKRRSHHWIASVEITHIKCVWWRSTLAKPEVHPKARGSPAPCISTHLRMAHGALSDSAQ